MELFGFFGLAMLALCVIAPFIQWEYYDRGVFPDMPEPRTRAERERDYRHWHRWARERTGTSAAYRLGALYGRLRARLR